MADFDLIGRVRLQVSQRDLNAIANRMDSSFSKKFKSLSFGTLLDPKLLGQLGRFGRAYEAFQERIRRADRLTQSQKKRFLGRGEKLFRSFAEKPQDFADGFRSELQLLKQAISRQQSINNQADKLKKLREKAADITDPKKRGGIVRSLNVLSGKVKSGDFIFDTQKFDKSFGKIVEKFDLAADLQKVSQKNAVELQKFADNTEARFKGVRSIVNRIGRSSLESRTKQDLLDQFLPDLFGKGTDPTKLKQFTRGIEDFSEAFQKAKTAQKGANKRPPKPPKSPPGGLDDDPAFAFGQQSALAFRRFAAFSIAAGGLFTLVQALREGISESIKFEQQLVKLAQVSNTSLSALGGFKRNIDDLSTSLGVASADLIESAVTIRQAGFSLDETKAALETLALTSLSPSFNDLKNTTEGLIALKSQFGTSADDFKRQFGEINAVSKAFAVESEDIVTAIRKSGGAFKVAGGDVTELIALFTAVRSTTRESADTIATGFRTIFGRLQRPQVIDELKAFNIELTDATGKFVGPLEAIKEINKALGDTEVGDLQFARIAEQIGGIRQISKVIPLIQQFAIAQRAANIALLGGNSLTEDSIIAQQSLANRLTKTKETFLAFARDITLGDQFKDLASGLLKAADAFTSFGKTIAPILPMLAIGFAIGQTKSIGRFGLGFLNKLGGAHGAGSAMDMSLLAASAGGTGAGRGRGRVGRFLRGNGAGIAAGVGLLGVGIGTSIGNTDPLTNRRRFIGGRVLAEGSGLGIGGAFAGGGIGTMLGGPGIGTAVGAGLGFAAGALQGFTSAVQEAQDALEEQQFRPAIDTLGQALSLVNSGKISPLGQQSNLSTGFAALRDRRLTATGAERDQLNGDIRQTVESLLQFIQVLSESSKTMEAFNAAGGDEAIKFISENSILSSKLLVKQTTDTIDAFRKAENVTRKLVTAQENLTSQANLISAFGASIADATARADHMSERFDFVANNLLGAGAVGVQFRGVAGFQDIFSRPGQVSDLGLLSGASNQAAGLLGPQFSGLGQQTVAISDILRQLPSILSEFAIKRPTGNIADSLDIFVRESLGNIAKNIPGGAISLEPIIDSIASSITSEISQQGKGQAEAIQKILDAPATFIEGVVSGSGFEQVFNLFGEAASRFTERFNTYSNQFAQITNRELQLREELVNSLGVFFGRLVQIERVRNPNQFPIGALRQQRLAQQAALLGPNAGLAGNPGAILNKRAEIQAQINLKEEALQRARNVKEITNYIEEIIKLQGETGVLTQAFKLAVDQSDNIAAKFAEIEQIQIGRDQRRQGAEDFVFGDRAARNQLNSVTAAAQFAAINPDAFFNPNVISDSLRPAIGDFLNRFSKLDIIPGLTGQQAKERILEAGVRRGVLNPQALEDLKADKLNNPQEKLLDEIKKLAEKELEDQGKLIDSEKENIKLLITGLGTILDKFITDLRKSLLEQQAQGVQNRVNAAGAQRVGLQGQLDKFGIVTGAGGDRNNTQNLTSLRVAQTFRNLQGRNTAISQLVNDTALLGAGNNRGFLRQGKLGLSSLANVLSEGDRSVLIGGGIKDNTINRVRADALAQNAFSSFAGDLGLPKGTVQDFSKQLTDKIADASNQVGDLTIKDFRNAIVSTFTDIAKEAQNNVNKIRNKANEDFGGFGQQQQGFVEALVNLPQDKFAEMARTINELGDAKLDKVTEAFNNLNREASVLSTTLQGLTGQIRALNPQPGGGVPAGAAGGGQPILDAVEAARQMLQNITNGLKDSLNGNNGITQAIQNIPKSIELSANHKVEVIINGAQVLAQLQPGLEQLVITETEKAINKFASNNLPGIGSFS